MNIPLGYFHPTVLGPIGIKALKGKSTSKNPQISWVKDETEGEPFFGSQIDPFEEFLFSKEFRAHVSAGRKQLKKDPSKLIDLTDL